MITSDSYLIILNKIIENDPRYSLEAYIFVQDAVSFTLDLLKDKGQAIRHVSGGELLEGIREFSLEQFGPMSKEVLGEWGISCTRDFGNIEYNITKVSGTGYAPLT